MENSKFIFWGTPDFAAVVLEKLIKADWLPAAVVCNPDRPVGRKKIITPPPVKRFIINGKLQTEILQPEKLDAEFKVKVSDFKPDFFVVASYGKIIPKEILDIPRLGTIVVHPSLLPKYRGSTPIQSAILNGEAETGTTLILADEKVDHGQIIAQKALENNELGIMNYDNLELKLAELSGDLLVEILPKYLNGEITPLTQDESQATYTKKFITQDGYVDPDALRKAQVGAGLEKDEAVMIERKVRALNPEPGVWTMKDGKRMKILEAELTPDKKLKLKVIQFEGKKPLAYN